LFRDWNANWNEKEKNEIEFKSETQMKIQIQEKIKMQIMLCVNKIMLIAVELLFLNKLPIEFILIAFDKFLS